VPYCITFRSKSDVHPTGWYTGDNCRWSTDHKRKKLFDQREDAEPVVLRLRELCPSNAGNINVETPGAGDADPRDERAARRITESRGLQISNGGTETYLVQREHF
jgi:hypothetical protein